MNVVLKKFLLFVAVVSLLFQFGCATNTRQIATGMLVGGIVGGAVGYEFVHHGEHKQFQTQDTIITALIFSLVTGAVLHWHYQAMAQQEVDISGRYARYRLCNPDDMTPDLAKQLQLGGDQKSQIYSIGPSQIGKSSISLDDNTKWAFPIFKKRFLPPETDETQVISKRYIWEIIKPGSFVTRTENPQYFFEVEKKDEKK